MSRWDSLKPNDNDSRGSSSSSSSSSNNNNTPRLSHWDSRHHGSGGIGGGDRRRTKRKSGGGREKECYFDSPSQGNTKTNDVDYKKVDNKNTNAQDQQVSGRFTRSHQQQQNRQTHRNHRRRNIYQHHHRKREGGPTGGGKNPCAALREQIELYKMKKKKKKNDLGTTDEPVHLKNSIDQFNSSFLRSTLSRSEKLELLMIMIDCLSIDDDGADHNEEKEGMKQSAVLVIEKLLSLKDDSIILTKVQSMHVLTVLCSRIHLQSCPSKSITYLRSLMLLVSSQTSSLPGERTAQEAVAKCFLPYLAVPSSEITRIDDYVLAVNTLIVLFQNKSHSSALFSPLIQDVSSDGQAKDIINPLRHRIFSIMQYILDDSSSSSSNRMMPLQALACRALTAALDAIRRLNHEGTTNADMKEIDLVSMESFIVNVFAKPLPDLFGPCLHLVRALIRRYKARTVRIGSKLIMGPFQGSVINETIAVIESEDKRPEELLLSSENIGNFFACIYHACTSSSTVNISQKKIGRPTIEVAMYCLSDFISIMPWNTWMGTWTGRQKNHSISGFRRKVLWSIEKILALTRCLFCRQDEALVEPLSALAVSLFLSVPFSDERTMKLAIDLWSHIANTCISSAASTTYLDAAMTVVVESIGGKETPQGERFPLCEPAMQWLSSEASSDFVRNLLEATEQQQQGQQHVQRQPNDANLHRATTVLVAILKTRPQTVYPYFSYFCRYIESLLMCQHHKTKHLGLYLLESIMEGRRDFGKDGPEVREHDQMTENMVSFISSIVMKRTKDDDVGDIQFRCALLRLYSAMIERDWISTANTNPGAVLFYLDDILTSLTDKSPKVRSAACKSLGELSSNLLSSKSCDEIHDDSLLSAFPKRICDETLKTLDDTNASVRSMGLFALGNLAHSLRSTSINRLGDVQGLSLHDDVDNTNNKILLSLLDVCNRILPLLYDSNDKVAGNAIRCIGHWGYLLSTTANDGGTISNFSTADAAASTFLTTTVKKGESDEEALFKDVRSHCNNTILNILESLVGKISNAIDASFQAASTVATNTTTTGLTWKQRSILKKHGWGACHSISQLLQSVLWFLDEDGENDINYEKNDGDNREKTNHIKEESYVIDAYRMAVEKLIECLVVGRKQFSSSFVASTTTTTTSTLNEKVILSAMSALGTTSQSNLENISGKSGLVGKAISICIVNVYESTLERSMVVEAISVASERLLKHLLHSASILDACVCLRQEYITNQSMEFVYQWMVTNEGISGRSFEIFALALQRSDTLVVDMTLEQRFASRALRLIKNEHSVDNILVADEDADEI